MLKWRALKTSDDLRKAALVHSEIGSVSCVPVVSPPTETLLASDLPWPFGGEDTA